MSNVLARTYTNVNPSNYPSSSVISYKNGSPLIQFIIGARASKIRPGSLRLNGRLTCKRGANTVLNDTDGVGFDSSTGVHGLIDSITVSNSENRTYETIKSYNRMMASYIKQSTSNDDTNTRENLSGLQSGNVFSSSDVGTTGTNNDFSIPLYTGLLIDSYMLDSSKMNGLNLTIMLSPDANFFFDTGVHTNASGAFYELSDVHLTFEEEVLTDLDMKMNAVEFTTINTFYGVSSNNFTTINFNLGLGNVLSWWLNVLPQTDVNNSTKNSMATESFVDNADEVDDVVKVEYLVGGQKYPIRFNLEGTPDENQYTTDIYRNFYDAFNPFMGYHANQRNPVNTPVDTALSDVQGENIVDCGPSWGLGCALDNVSYSGFTGYDRNQWGIIIETKSSDPKPTSIYVFIRNKQVINF